jgi:putative methionine-R-sulfoxide reductase with GAF domain
MNKWNTFIQFRNYSLRTKMILMIVAIVVGSVGIVAFLTNRSLTANLTENIGNNLAELANARSTEIGLAVQREIQGLKVLALSKTLQNAVMIASQKNPLSQNEINQLDQQWRAANEANNDADPLVASVLNNEISSELRIFREQFPQQVEVFLTDTQGVNIASTNRTSDYLQADEEWWQTAYKDGQYIGQPEFDESSKTVAMNMAVTIRQNGDGEILGVLRTTVNFTALSDSLIAGLFGQTGRTDIYLPDGQEFKLIINEDSQYEMIQEDSAPDIKALAGSTQNYMHVSLDGNTTLASKAKVALPGITGEDTKAIENLNWYVITLQDQSEALQPVSAQTRNVLLLAFGISIAAAFAAIFLAQFISGPIVRLKAIAEQVASGDLTAQAKVETSDETGALATAFNAMTSQLHDLIGSLEQRVADRTKALATSAEVSRRLATILDPRQLVNEVVNEVRTAFDYYYAQIYLLDKAGENAVLAGGTGEAGAKMVARGHLIPVGRGLVGRAAESNEPILVSDTSQDPNWLPNELLPETKAEAAIPISVGNQVLGVLDVQHSLVNGLTTDDVTLLESLAGQVAISLQNARSYEQSRKQAELESLVNVISQRIQRTTSVEDALQTAIRELGTAIGASRVKASLRSASSAISTAPVALADSPVAVIEGEEGAFDPEGTLADDQQNLPGVAK